ncbi:hypothetical protein F0562_033044 [Nyssa sinensis]|uniref:GDSL esterase/lipase n=1 Tax=Nyssa sinensis TaxID=561372 RepID=A0A5J5ARD1_9ASTE|nr:hypothetical protein F0562_033044 [Nyssa sinensis]
MGAATSSIAAKLAFFPPNPSYEIEKDERTGKLRLTGVTERDKGEVLMLRELFNLFTKLSDQLGVNFMGSSFKRRWRKQHPFIKYFSYGSDFMWENIATGRFTNGKTITDFIADSIGLSYPIDFITEHEFTTKAGYNYASASAGILPKTGSAFGETLRMKKQIDLFRETARKHLPKFFETAEELSHYLSKSIFVIHIGSSDDIYNYIDSNHYDSSCLYNDEQFGELLVNELGNHLKDLYNLVARKMIIFQIGPLGCLPYVINRIKPKTRCAKDVNKMVSILNQKLDVKLKELSQMLDGSTILTGQIYPPVKNMVENPINYGVTETRLPCCTIEENGLGLCKRFSPICPDRKSCLFWDELHTSLKIQIKFLQSVALP